MSTSTPPAKGNRWFLRPWLFYFILALALLKGIRMPNRWAVTHYLFTYQTGFMKRAFWGEVLWRVLGTWTAKYFCLAAVGLVVFAVLITLLVRLCRRCDDDDTRATVLLVLSASPAVSFAAHMVGYLEQVIYVGVLLVLLHRRNWSVQVGLALAMALLLPLVHEASILWVGALAGLSLLTSECGRRQSWSSRLAALAAVSVVWIAMTLVVSHNGQVSTERAAAIRDDRTAFSDIRPRQDAFQTLTVPLAASLADMRVRWADPNAQFDMMYSLLVFGPAAAFLLVVAGRRIRTTDESAAWKWTTAGLVAAAVMGPLMLHFVGWDRHRWNALAALNAGIATLVLLAGTSAATATPTRHDERPGARGAPPRRLAVAFALCLWSLASEPVFFDAYGPAHPPFTYHVQFLIEAIRDRQAEIWIPRPGN